MSELMLSLLKGAVLGAFVLVNTAAVQGQEPIPRSADYEVLFEPTWNAETHPNAYPEEGRLGIFTGGTHGEEFTIWKEGEPASEGVQTIAEGGYNSGVAGQVRRGLEQGTAGQLVARVADMQPPLVVTFTDDHPLVSLVVSLQPSPDWFAGISGLSLLEETGWVEHKVVELFAYDAGTDSGTEFSSPDSPTVPPEPIQRITTGELGTQPVARITFQLLQAPTEHPLFQRGDANSDGKLDLSDAVFILEFLFLGGPEPSCAATADTDDIGVIDITSSLRILTFLFGGLQPPQPPVFSCGVDTTLGRLSCESYPPCE